MLYYRAAATNTRIPGADNCLRGEYAVATEMYFRELQKHIVPGLCTDELDVSVYGIPFVLDAILVLKGYNGFRGSIYVNGYGRILSKAIPYGRVDMRETGFKREVNSMGCKKRNLMSVFRTSLIQSKHMLRRVASFMKERHLKQIPFDLKMGT